MSMIVYEAPEEPTIEELYSEKYTRIFLAGGITDCRDWQKDVIEELGRNFRGRFENLIIFNPRCPNFDTTDPLASRKQIKWEFNKLEHMDIFAMYFCNSESVQPICLYELGRNIVRMQQRFPLNWASRIIIGVEKGYSREDDVREQTYYATDYAVKVWEDMDTDMFAHMLRNAYYKFN